MGLSITAISCSTILYEVKPVKSAKAMMPDAKMKLPYEGSNEEDVCSVLTSMVWGRKK